MAVVHTGKFLSPDQQKEIRQATTDAVNTPAIVLTQRHLGPNGRDEATIAVERFHKRLNDMAMMLGLPDPGVDVDGDPINYGFNPGTGEILAWEPD